MQELENQLQETVARFRNLFDNAPCFISVQDRDFRILESNLRFNDSFGNGAGLHCYEVYKKRQAPCLRCPVMETFADGGIHTSEESVMDNLGNKLHTLVYTAPIRDRAGAITSVMEMSTDITEIRTLQNRLATLGELVGGMAHSIKNILEGLRGGVYIVNLGFRDSNQEDIRRGWEMVERNVTRLSALIMDMLCCARDRAPRRLPVSLGAVAGDVIALFTPRAAQYGIRLECEAAGGVDVFGEPKDLHALMSNLVANAIDACNEDTREREHHVVLRIRRDSEGPLIEVQDNGAGMSQETRNALFLGHVSTKGPAGTGLGLMVAHKVATEHGGQIAVRSEPGNGSLFAVRLPAAPPIAQASAGPEGKAPEGKAM